MSGDFIFLGPIYIIKLQSKNLNKRLLVIYRSKWKNNIKITKYEEYDSSGWIRLYKNTLQRWTLQSTGINLRKHKR